MHEKNRGNKAHDTVPLSNLIDCLPDSICWPEQDKHLLHAPE